MNDRTKTDQELLEENSFLYQRIQELEQSESERNQVEEALRESETKLQAIFDTVGTGILIIDKNTQIIIEANQTAIDMTGLPKERIIDRSLILESRRHPEQGFRSCLGVMRLAKHYAVERLEAACARALSLNACSYKHVKSILEKGLDNQPLPPAADSATPVLHYNIRGKDYYQRQPAGNAQVEKEDGHA